MTLTLSFERGKRCPRGKNVIFPLSRFKSRKWIHSRESVSIKPETNDSPALSVSPFSGGNNRSAG
jgi:hypothetical protein